jgi:hypothetical protein
MKRYWLFSLFSNVLKLFRLREQQMHGGVKM